MAASINVLRVKQLKLRYKWITRKSWFLGRSFWMYLFWCLRFQPLCLVQQTISPRCLGYKRHELLKKRQHDQQVREVEHASFTPLVLSATGGMAKEATIFYKRLAVCLSSKWDQPYSMTLAWLRSRITFSLLRSAIQCIRGACSSVGHAARSPTPPLDLVNSELCHIA